MKNRPDDHAPLHLELRFAFRIHANRRLTFSGLLALAVALAKAFFVQ